MLGFSHIAWALDQVTMGGGKEKNLWAMFQKKSFNDLKKHFFSSLILSLSYLQHPFEIDTYGSDYVLGVVITQHGHLVVYNSETLSAVVRKYPTYDK
jgi:hypothetical protein